MTYIIKTKTYMEHNPDESTPYCAPYRSDNGRVSAAVYEGYLSALNINGEEIHVSLAQNYTEQEPLWERISRAALDSEDDAYLLDQETRRYSWREIALMDALVEHGCSSCPWRDICDAMQEEMSIPSDEAGEYAEDEIIDTQEDEEG